MFNRPLIIKEIREYTQTPKGLILIALFLFFALTSPASAKFMNEIIAALASDITITFPDPTLQDSWIQVFKNINSICLIVYVIVMSATISQEKSKGSILLVLTKRVSRFQFLISKFIVGVLVYTLLLLASTIASAWYTHLLFGDFMYDGLITSLVLYWLMGVFYTALSIFVSVIGKNPTTSALLGFFAYAVLQILNISNDIALYNPAGASSLVNGIIGQTIDTSQLWISILSTIILTTIILFVSQSIFKKQEI
jgi:ABC-2 type transport system permease protein